MSEEHHFLLPPQLPEPRSAAEEGLFKVCVLVCVSGEELYDDLLNTDFLCQDLWFPLLDAMMISQNEVKETKHTSEGIHTHTRTHKHICTRTHRLTDLLVPFQKKPLI